MCIKNLISAPAPAPGPKEFRLHRPRLRLWTWIRDLKNWIWIRPKSVEVTNIMTSRFFFFVESVLFLFKLLKLFQAALNKFNIRSDRDLSFLPDPDLNSLFRILIILTTTIILYSKRHYNIMGIKP